LGIARPSPFHRPATAAEALQLQMLQGMLSLSRSEQAHGLLRQVVTFNLNPTPFQPLHISRKINQNLIDI
jgi:hypothetical protein